MTANLQIDLGSAQVRYRGDADTRVFGVIGHPVAHSLSPRFQQAALDALGINAVYLSFDVQQTELRACLERAREWAQVGRLAGLNVTLPHKTAVIQELDQLDREAGLAGAVNTIVCERSGVAVESAVRLLGANTDIAGLTRALSACGVEMRKRVVVIIGSGGAARAAVVAALHGGASEIRLVSRSLPRAQAVLESVSGLWTGRLPRMLCVPLTTAGSTVLAGAKLLIQATSLGLQEGEGSPLSLEGAPRDLFVLDLIYNPMETALLCDARSRGLRAENGLRMLVYQGAEALQRWLSVEAPVGVMLASVGLRADAP